MDLTSYPFTKHLNDLRRVLVRSLLGVLVGLVACFSFADRLLAWLLTPVKAAMGPGAHLIVLTPHEYFFTEMKAALMGGILLSSPWIFYQVWLFVAPGLYQREKKFAFAFVFSTALCFVGGILFAQYCVFPSIFRFFVSTLPTYVEGQYSIGLLFAFSTNLLLAFGLVFETPVLVFLLAFLGLAELDSLKSGRRYVIVLAFVVGAILTPTPDPLTQTLMAVPIIVLYELGLLFARLALKSGTNQITDLR